MKHAIIVLLLYYTAYVRGDNEDTKDLGNPEDLERRHRKHRRPQNSGPCGSYGRTFGFQDHTYISAPVMNYFFGCGVAPAPVAPAPVAPYPQLAPAAAYPLQIGVSQAQHHGHHGYHGQHGHHGQHGGHQDNYGGGNQGALFGGFPSAYPMNQPYYGQGAFQQPIRPFQNVVSAAAAGFGNVLADYITRPRKTQKQINKILKPIYKLF